MLDPNCPNRDVCAERAQSRTKTLPDGRAAIQVPDGEYACQVAELHEFMDGHLLDWFSNRDGIDVVRRQNKDAVVFAAVDHWIIADPDGFDGFLVQAKLAF